MNYLLFKNSLHLGEEKIITNIDYIFLNVL